jgi:hypothetical protein
MQERTLNRPVTDACVALYQALSENTDSLGFEELSTTELMAIQSYINELLIERFKPLREGINALIQLEDNAFNSIQN